MARQINILIALALLPVISAYTIVDYETFDYTGNSTILAENGWFAGTGYSLDFCEAQAGYMECSMPAAGNLTTIHHKFNLVDSEYCLGLNGDENVTSNFSIRYNIRYPPYEPVGNFGTTPSNRPMPTMGTAWISNRDLSIYLIGSANSSGIMQYKLHSQTGSEIVKNFSAWDSDWHEIQIDFYPYQYASVYPNMTMGNATLWVDDVLIGNVTNTAAPPLRYGCRNSTYFQFLASLSANAIIDIDSLAVINYDEGEAPLPPSTPLNVTGQPTSCTSYSPPYYLKEQFISGYPSLCGWYITPDIDTPSTLTVTNELDYVSLYKPFKDTTTGSNVALDNKYQTIKFEYNVNSDTISPNAFAMWIYNAEFNTIIQMQVDNQSDLYNVQDTTTLVSAEASETWNSVKIITDLDSNNFDVYVNDVLKLNNMDFYSTNQEATNIYVIQFQSAYSHYQIDNIEVYTSDSNGNPINAPIITPSLDINGTYLFGMFYKDTPDCTTDDDCVSGMCLRGTSTCSAANYKVCDENGWNRTDWCLFKGLFVGFLSWVGDLFLSNLFYFIILLIILMIIVYLVKIARKGG